MSKKVTVQNIADDLHLSRTTVSKVLNHASDVAPETRDLVLRKAKELNYKNFGSIPAPAPESVPAAKGFAFFLHMIPDALHIGSSIMTQMERELRKNGYTLSLHLINDSDLANLTLPPNFYPDQIAAIVCIEVFDSAYSRLLSSIGVPVLFIDASADFHELDLKADLIMPENIYSTRRMLSMIMEKKQISTVGVVGDINHCLSFRQRYEGTLMAAEQYHFSVDGCNIIADDSNYGDIDWLSEQVQKLPSLPDLFLCLNDVIAFLLIQALEKLGYEVPSDVLVCGYDGVPTYNSVISTLTTVRVSGQDIGTAATHLLLNRIASPFESTSSTYLNTKVILRHSTE
jgi:LacI family transcriptional regulator